MSDYFSDDSRDFAYSEEPDRSTPSQRQLIVPGKVSLTSRIAPAGPVLSPTSVPSQRESGAAIQASRSETAAWMNVAFRPDLHEAPVQRKRSSSAIEATPIRTGDGRPIPEHVRTKMETVFGADFSSVRVHEGLHAQALGALAYTQGPNIHFAPGHYQPETHRGQELLGHELTHVVQQSQGRVQPTMQAKGVAINTDVGLEREADEMGATAARGELARATQAPGLQTTMRSADERGAIQRQTAPGNNPGTTETDNVTGQAGDEAGLSPQARALLQRFNVTNTGLPQPTLQRFSAALEQVTQGVATLAPEVGTSTPVDNFDIQVIEAEYQLSLTVSVDRDQRKTRIQLSFEDSDGQNMAIAFEHSPMPLAASTGSGIGSSLLDLQPPPLEGERFSRGGPLELRPQQMAGPPIPSAHDVVRALLGGQGQSGDMPSSFGLCPVPEPPQSGDDEGDQALKAELQQVQEQISAIDKELALAIADGAIDVAGVFDPTPISDGIATIRDLSRGDWLGAGLSAISIIPYVGDAIAKPLKGARLAKRVARLRASLMRLEKRRARLQELVQESLLRRKSGKIGEGSQDLSNKLTHHNQNTFDEVPSHSNKELDTGNHKASGDKNRGDKNGGNKENWERPKGWRLPKNGKWDGQPGNSDFIPDDPKMLGLADGDKIPFRQGYPDFSKWATESLEVASMTGKHTDDMKLIYQKLARDKGWLKPNGQPNASRAQAWLREQQLTPHHAGGNNVELVPRKLHDNIRHTGGAFELRNTQ